MLTIEKKKERKSKLKSKAASFSSSSHRSMTPLSMQPRYLPPVQYKPTNLQNYNSPSLLSTLLSTLYSLHYPLSYSNTYSQFAQVKSSRSIQSSQINEIENCLGESQGCFGISERERAREPESTNNHNLNRDLEPFRSRTSIVKPGPPKEEEEEQKSL